MCCPYPNPGSPISVLDPVNLFGDPISAMWSGPASLRPWWVIWLQTTCAGLTKTKHAQWSHGVICSCRLMQDLSWNECTFGAELGMMIVWAECCMMRVFLRWVSANQAWIVHSNCTNLDGRYLSYVQFNRQGYWMANPWAQTGHSVVHQLHHESQQSSRIGQERLAFESATMHFHRHVILRVHYGGGKSRELCDSISVGVACAFASLVGDSIQERSDQHIHLPSNWGRNPNALLFALFINVLGFQVQMQRPCSNSGIF